MCLEWASIISVFCVTIHTLWCSADSRVGQVYAYRMARMARYFSWLPLDILATQFCFVFCDLIVVVLKNGIIVKWCPSQPSRWPLMHFDLSSEGWNSCVYLTSVSIRICRQSLPKIELLHRCAYAAVLVGMLMSLLIGNGYYTLCIACDTFWPLLEGPWAACVPDTLILRNYVAL